MLAAGLAGLTQIQEDARRAIDALARNERSTDQAKESGVLLPSLRNWLPEPVVVSTWSHVEKPAHRIHGVLASVGLNELIQ
jgi:HPt (histidine-containing phosphotransfer) domain-containing protein